MVPPKEKLINSSIFGSFNKLTNDDESARIKGAYALIKSLVESSDKEPEKVKIMFLFLRLQKCAQ